MERPVNGQLYNAHEIRGPVQVLPGGSKVMQLTCENEAQRLACTAVSKVRTFLFIYSPRSGYVLTCAPSPASWAMGPWTEE